jgi:NAD(P)-dependent dehydrogenase (short-subunit alcohol dehydrogenase family)
MIARGSGAIVNISTAAASASLAEAPVYGAIKAALETLTHSWAAAFGANGIRVNPVAAGPRRTDSAIDTRASRLFRSLVEINSLVLVVRGLRSVFGYVLRHLARS